VVISMIERPVINMVEKRDQVDDKLQ